MRLSTLWVLAGLVTSVHGLSEAQQTTVVHNVHLIAMDGDTPSPRSDHAVVIAGGAIQTIGPEGDARTLTGARLIDGRGGFLAPGLIDTHVHHREHVDYGNYLAHGVTTVLGLGQGDSLESFLEIRRDIEAGRIEGPTIYTTGGTIANHIRIEEAEAARQYVRTLARDGLDFIKIYNNVPKEVFDAIVAEGQAQGLSVFGHLPRTFSVDYALSHGLNVVAHAEEFYFAFFGGPRDQELDGFDGSLPDLSQMDAIIDVMREHDVALIANLHFTFSQMRFWDDVETVMADPELLYLHPELRASWRRGHSANRTNARKRLLRERVKYGVIHELVRRSHEAGVLVVAGTDAPLPAEFPGKGLHSELRELIKSGLSDGEALRTATRNAGVLIERYVDDGAKVGRIAPGYEADLVLYRANPLDDIRNVSSAAIAGVMKDGVWMDREKLDALRAAARAAAEAAEAPRP